MNRNIEYIIIDVDGTMTDAGIYYDETGNEYKKFCTKDAAGFFAAKAVGIKTIVMTGRECQATTRRMEELKVDFLFQGIKDKVCFLKEFMRKNKITKAQMAYIGDDINDLQPMALVGYKCCPYDASEEIKNFSDYVSPICGGHGVVTDVVRYILNKTDEWNEAIKNVYGAGV